MNTSMKLEALCDRCRPVQGAVTQDRGRLLRKVSLAAAALFAIITGTVTIQSAPAEAKPQQCLAKYHGCQNRCFKNNGDPFPCVQRTCDRQYENCVKSEDGPSGGGGGKGK